MIRHSSITGLSNLVNDAWRFVYSHLEVILQAPLQLYVSALVFSPTGSMIRQLFTHEEPTSLTTKPRMGQDWSACLLKLDLSCALACVLRKVAISPNGRRCVRPVHHAAEVYNIGWNDRTHLIKLTSSARTASFAPNGEHLAVGLEMGAVELLDTNTGRRIREFVGHKGLILALAFSPNGKLLASASSEVIILWDLSTGQQLQTMDCRTAISMSFSVDSQRLASGLLYGEVRVWKVPSGDCIWSIEGHEKLVNSIAFLSRDLLVSGSDDTTVKIWNLAEGTCIQTLQTRCEFPSVVSLQDGSRFAYVSNDEDTVINVCNERGVYLQTINVRPKPMETPALVFLPGPQLLAGTSENLTLWDLASELSEQDDQEGDGGTQELVLSRDGRYLASVSIGQRVRLWDTSASTHCQTLGYDLWNTLEVVLTFSDNSQLLVEESYEGLWVWDTATGGHRGTYDANQVLHVSPDGQKIVLISLEDTTMIRDLSTGDCIQKIKADLQGSRLLVNGNCLVLTSGNGVQVWNILQLRCIASFSMPSPKEAGEHNGTLDTIALSNDSNLIAVKNNDLIQVWDLTTQKLLHELDVEAKFTSLLAFSLDGELMLYHNNVRDTVEILKLKTGTLLHSIQLPRRLWQKEWRLDPDDQSQLCTEIGIIDLTDSLRGPDFEIEEARRQPPHTTRYYGYGLSLDGAWILKGSTRILYLPLEYRIGATAAGSIVAIANKESGRVSVLRFAEEGQNEDGR